MTGLGGRLRGFQRAHLPVHPVEVVADHFQGDVIGHRSRLGQVGVGQLRDLHLGRHVLIFGAKQVERRSGHEAWRLGALEPDELLELPDGRERDEVELLPKAIQLMLLRLVQHQVVERAIVPEIAHLTVKAGAQQTVAFGVRGDLAGVGEEHAAAFRDVEPIGEQRTKTCERILVPRPRVLRGRYQQEGIRLRVRGHVQLQRVTRVGRPVIRVLAILPEHERLRAGGDPACRQVLERHRHARPEHDDEIAHPFDGSA